MTTLNFEILIDSTPEKIWKTLWHPTSYTAWVQPFCHGSTALTDWQAGSNYQFLDPQGNGLFGKIMAHTPNQHIHFKHDGEVKELLNQATDSLWKGLNEIYTLTTTDDGCLLKTLIEVEDNSVDFFKETFPLAWSKVKLMCEKNMIAIETSAPATTSKAWEVYTQPQFVQQWNFAADEWHCPAAQNTLMEGGHFKYNMAAKDGSFAFDFKGEFIRLGKDQFISIKLEDGRLMEIFFIPIQKGVRIVECFEPETQNPIEMQEQGWQLILNNYAKVLGNSI